MKLLFCDEAKMLRTPCYEFDSGGADPSPTTGSPRKGTVEAPLPPCGASFLPALDATASLCSGTLQQEIGL